MAHPTLFILQWFSVLLAVGVRADTGLLYFTDFDNFPIGNNQWAGQDGWVANDSATTGGIQGIDSKAVPGIGQSAFLGFKEPTTTWNYVSKAINHDPTAENSASIEIDTLIGLEDSTNDKYDSFFVGFYNIAGDFLAAIQFSNEREAFGIYREDGSGPQDTTVDFLYGELQLLNVDIDLKNNLWSADFDGIPLFRNKTFTTTGHTRTFGLLTYEWQTTDADPANHGDNWLLVADCSIWAIPPGIPEVTVDEIMLSEAGQPNLQFLGEPGWTYQVEYTGTLGIWDNNLPSSTFSITGPAQMIEFTDMSPSTSGSRFYRIDRQVTP